MLEAQGSDGKDVTAFEMKQATMPDTPNTGSHLFQGVRPTIVTDEGVTRDTFSKETIAEAAMSGKVSVVDLDVSSNFEHQFASQYSCRVPHGH